jgi:Protein of unknown function (DUF4089)
MRFAEDFAARGGREREVSMKQQDETLEALVAATAQALGLSVDPTWRDGVKFHLRLLLDHAARVDAFALAAEAEPAPVFHA